MNISIFDQESLVDERINVKISELVPNSRLRVDLKFEMPWCKGEEFSSYAVFVSDEKGEVDFDNMQPVEGTYSCADAMGLIYSAKKSRSEGKNFTDNISIDNPIIMYMGFEGYGEKKKVVLKRSFKTEDVHMEKVNSKFVGQLFYSDKSNGRTILMLGGSDGNIAGLTLMAAPLASKGFNVLIVSYFAGEGLKERLEEIPLEYFETIFDWMSKHEKIKAKEIFLHGTSKGGELALLLASRYKQIKKVVAVEPHAYCFQALDGLMSGKNVSSWSYKGESIPYIEVDNNIFFEDQEKDIEKGIPFGFASTYRKSIERAENKETARIKLENSEADILLISGKCDNIWNSYDGCLEIVKNLKKNNFKHSAELLAYEKMGHPLPIPYIIPISETLAMDMNGGIFSSGGNIEGNAEGQYKSFKRTIEFFSDTV